MIEWHFLRPAWLLALLPIAYWWWQQRRLAQFAWQQLLPAHLQQWLLSRQAAATPPPWRLLLALLLAVFGLAGPSWERLPQPLYQLDQGQVLLMDMSLSLRATDVPPDRLSQARFKAMDLVKNYLDGETGLVAYAGDAFVISPLTTDGANLENLIRALSPELMPSYGNNPLAGLQRAAQLLADAGYRQGAIYWLTDDVDAQDMGAIQDWQRQSQLTLHVLALGTATGAPITLTDGNLLRDSNGQVVIAAVPLTRLADLAAFSGGRFAQLTADSADLAQLTAAGPTQRSAKPPQQSAATSDSLPSGGDQWLDRGPWFWLLALLLLLPSIRRPLFNLPLLPLSALALLAGTWSPPSVAQATSKPLQQAWQTPYQQADAALQQQQFERAAELSTDPWQRGTAYYRAGDYAAAAAVFAELPDAIGRYNEGNSYMQLGQYEDAKARYQQALQQRPDWPEAQQNLALAEQLLAQQQEQQQDQSAASDAENQQQQQEQQQGQQQDQPQQQNSEEHQQQSDPNQAEQPQQQTEQESEQETEQQAEQPPATEPNAEQTMPQQPSQEQQWSEEQQQQLEQWLNRIEDDPALLLRNKMRLEAQQRRPSRSPTGVRKQW